MRMMIPRTATLFEGRVNDDRPDDVANDENLEPEENRLSQPLAKPPVAVGSNG